MLNVYSWQYIVTAMSVVRMAFVSHHKHLQLGVCFRTVNSTPLLSPYWISQLLITSILSCTTYKIQNTVEERKKKHYMYTPIAAAALGLDVEWHCCMHYPNLIYTVAWVPANHDPRMIHATSQSGNLG